MHVYFVEGHLAVFGEEVHDSLLVGGECGEKALLLCFMLSVVEFAFPPHLEEEVASITYHDGLIVDNKVVASF